MNKKVLSKETIGKNKIVIIAIAIILIVLVALVFSFGKGKDKVNDLVVNYSKGEEIKFHKFSKNFKETRTITIKNTSKEPKTYSLEWIDVTNTLKKQNKFVYEIKGSGDRVAELGKSQVPVADSVVFTQVLIEAEKTQTYTITFTYSGNEDANFTGKLKVKSREANQKITKKEDKKKELDEKAKKEAQTNKKKA